MSEIMVTTLCLTLVGYVLALLISFKPSKDSTPDNYWKGDLNIGDTTKHAPEEPERIR